MPPGTRRLIAERSRSQADLVGSLICIGQNEPIKPNPCCNRAFETKRWSAKSIGVRKPELLFGLEVRLSTRLPAGTVAGLSLNRKQHT
jgi:hypothetical protein